MFKKLLESLFFRSFNQEKKGSISKDDEELVLSSLSENEELLELLKDYLFRDTQRYFSAGDDRSRNIIRGQYIRTLYFLRKINPKKPKAEKIKNKDNKINNPRYG